MGKAPSRLADLCVDLAKREDVVVRCPRLLPHEPAPGRLTIAHRDLAAGSASYLIDAEIEPASGDTPFHVVIGGTTGPYSLRTRAGRWPRSFPKEDPLRLVPERPLEPGETSASKVRVTVLGRPHIKGVPAIVLRMPEYPLGGFNASHVIALWKRERAWYIVSLHFDQDAPSVARQVALVLETARSVDVVRSDAPSAP